jgi:AcrR family transcriptional regulator
MKSSEKIINAFIEFQLLNGRKPHSVLELTKKLKTEESSFYEHFSSLDKITQEIPVLALKTALKRIETDDNFQEFTGREKLLGLFFTLFEELQHTRSYYLFNYKNFQDVRSQSKDWKPFLSDLDLKIDEILAEAKKDDEIKDRALIGEHYSKGFKLVFTYLFRVWVNDDSEGFSTTDAAIEKTINLSFDMLQSNQLDALIDFGKFAFKTKVK